MAPSPPPDPSPKPAALAAALARLRASPVTCAFAAANLALLTFAEAHGRTTETLTLVRFGACESALVGSGEVWRLATAMFLHIGWIHLLWNTYAAWGLCLAAERALGSARFAATYFVAGVGGNCASAVGHHAVCAGASGALFGILGVYLVFMRRAAGDSRTFLAHPATRSVLRSVAIWFVLGMTVLPMDNFAHAGGLVTGIAVAALFTSRLDGRVVGASVASLLAALVIAGARPWHRSLSPAEADFLAFYGYACATGEGVPKDPARGVALLRRACDAGSAPACQGLDSVTPAL
ncbi:MAG TPA: rhomboid family intramembrane serine protease [Polyangiaceae bacterium]|nr:rhomboid family intramembrane serine protease [Polyangiaceae bacterium]